MSLQNRTEAMREELVERLARGCSQEGSNPVADHLYFYKASGPTHPVHGLFSPAVCVVAQGAKEAYLGDEVFRYDQNHFLLGSLDVPIIGRVVEATPEKPHLSVKLELDPAIIASVSVEVDGASTKAESSVRSMATSELSDELLDAFLRLVRLLDTPSDYRMVAPLVIREIIYRLLISEQGQRLRQMAVFGGQTQRIAKAVETLRKRYDETIRIEDLAHELGMSISSFHQHFKTATTMSPLQFQKQLRLQEARRLLIAGDMDASSAAVRVGYDDPSQFSREYKRLFGEPPMRDIERFKQLAAH